MLANLKYFTIGLSAPLPRPEQEGRRSSSPTRTVLPALTLFKFQGTSDYLDAFVARIDAPLLDSFFIISFDRTIQISQLAQFTRRTTRFRTLNEAHVDFEYYVASVQVEYRPPAYSLDEKSRLTIKFTAVLSELVRVFTSLFPPIYTVEHLYTYATQTSKYSRQWEDPMQWLDFFRPFTVVKNFYVVKELAQYIAPALQELVGESVTDFLPALESLYLEEFQQPRRVRKAIRRFVAARQLLGRPVTVSHWKNEGLLLC